MMPRLSDEQKVARRLGLGASDISELIGISPYEGASPVRLFAEKTGLVPDEDDIETKEQMVGHALELPLVKLYERESGRTVSVSGEYVESVVDEQDSWMRCNLDGRIEGARIALEIKCVGIGMASDWDLLSDDGIPHYVRTQCAWQMRVADLDEVHVVALVAGPSGFRVYYVKRDRELESALVTEARAFWLRVQERRIPPLDASSASKELLERLYPPPPTDVEVQAPDELVDMMKRRIRAAAAEARAGEAKEILNNEIREAMGKLGATVAWSAEARATWRSSRDGKRPLLVKAAGDAKVPRAAKGRKPNAAHPPLIDDGEVF